MTMATGTDRIADRSREILECIPRKWVEFQALMIDLKHQTGRNARSINPSIKALEDKGRIERRCISDSRGDFLCYEVRRIL
jgi:hypothetical protein